MEEVPVLSSYKPFFRRQPYEARRLHEHVNAAMIEFELKIRADAR